MTIRALPFVLLTGFLFGSTLVASRFSVGQFEPVTYISLRLIIASGAFLLLIATRKEFTLPREPLVWGKAAILGVFGTAVNLVAVVSSLQYISSGMSSVLLTLVPAVTVVLAHFFLPAERLGLRQWFGVILAFGGALLLTLTGTSGIPDVASADPRGYLLMFLAVGSGSVMTIYTRRVLRDLDSTQVASVRMLVATVCVVPLALFAVENDFSQVNAQGILATIYAGATGTFLGFFIQLYTVQRFGAVPGAMVTYVVPLFAGVGGVLILGEQFTPLMIVGITIIFCGIALVQRTQARKQTSAAPA